MRNDERKDEKIISKLYEAQAAKEIVDDIASFNKTLDSIERPTASDRILKDIKLKLEHEINKANKRRSIKVRIIKIAAMVAIVIGLGIWGMRSSLQNPRHVKSESYSMASLWQETSSSDDDIEQSITMIEDELFLPSSSSDLDIYDSELYDLEGEIETVNTTLWKG